MLNVLPSLNKVLLLLLLLLLLMCFDCHLPYNNYSVLPFQMETYTRTRIMLRLWTAVKHYYLFSLPFLLYFRISRREILFVWLYMWLFSNALNGANFWTNCCIFYLCHTTLIFSTVIYKYQLHYLSNKMTSRVIDNAKFCADYGLSLQLQTPCHISNLEDQHRKRTSPLWQT